MTFLFDHIRHISFQLSSNVNAEEEQSQAAAQFETACSDRIKQFDDSDSDEEVGGDGGDGVDGGGVW